MYSISTIDSNHRVMIVCHRRLIIGRPDDIVNPEALEREDNGGEAAPLDLGHCVFQHALLPELIGVDPKTLPR